MDSDTERAKKQVFLFEIEFQIKWLGILKSLIRIYMSMKYFRWNVSRTDKNNEKKEENGAND